MMTSASNNYADVSVIMPAYRAAGTIARALMSVAGQTLKPKSVIVVDDGSPDDTFRVAESCRGAMAGIDFVLLQQDNSGPGAARNRALREASTRYVAFLDADDEWLPEKLARTMAHMTDDSLILIAHDSMELDGATQTRLDCAQRFRAASAEPFAGLYRRGFIDTTTVVAELAAVRLIGGFDVTLPNAQDFDLWLALLANPKDRFLVFDEVLSYYHRVPGSVMSHVERRRRCCMVIVRRYARVLRKHPGSPLNSLVFRTLAVHREAVTAHRAAGKPIAMLATLAVLPFSLAYTLFHYAVGVESPRRDFLSGADC